MLCSLRGLCLFILILHRDLAYAYPQRISSRSGTYTRTYINQQGSQLISQTIPRRIKNRAAARRRRGITTLRIVERFIGIYISRSVTPTL